MAELASSVLAVPEAPVSGPVLFARYACPPNQHGYCGPADADSFFSSGVTRNEVDLRARARDFDGALPFLRLIAEAADQADPLDPAVVEAYWLGGPALEQAGSASAANRPGAASGPLFTSLGAAARAGAVPHHSFVVFCVYPWVAMLGDARRTPQAMRVLNGCRIRWGRVLEVSGDTVTAASEPLVWDGQQLGYGATAVEKVRWAIDGRRLASPLAVGDAVALHWDWVCDRISENQQRVLQHYSARHLALVNQVLAGRGAGR